MRPIFDPDLSKYKIADVVVTTSGFGPDAHKYAARHGRIQLIEGPELLHLLKERLDLDALLGDVKVRRRPRRES